MPKQDPISRLPAVLNTDYVLVPTDTLKCHPRNVRKGNLKKIKLSILANGFFGALVVQRSSGYILIGNHRFMAASALSLPVVPVLYVDVDDDRALRLMLTDNQTSDEAQNDPQGLAVLLAELSAAPDALAGTGFDGADLDALLAQLEGAGKTPPNLDPGLGRYKEQYAVIITCESEAAQKTAYDELMDAGYVCRVVCT